MNRIVLIFILASLFKPLGLNAKEYNLKNISHVINFSSYCKIGRIAIFQISFEECPPCHALHKALIGKKYNMDIVDIYHCVINLEDEKSLNMWKRCEGIYKFPALYIFGPTGNPVIIYRQDDPDFTINNIDEVVKSLIASLKYFSPKKMDYNSINKNQIFVKDSDRVNHVKAANKSTLNKPDKNIIYQDSIKYDSLLKAFTYFMKMQEADSFADDKERPE